MSDVQIRLDAATFRRRQRELGKAPKDTKKFIRREMKKLGGLLQRSWRSEFVGQMTDPESRRRDDRSPALGRFTGKGQRSIGVRTKFPNPNKPGNTVWKTFVGPRGGAGKPGPGFYLAFHEFGSRVHRTKRPLANLTRRLHEPKIRRDLEAIVRQVLRGW